MQIIKVSPETLFCHDQSLLNIHFYHSWLELSSLWNWQNSDKVNLGGEFVSPCLIHFVGATKIWNSDNGCFTDKYHATLSAYLGEQVSDTQFSGGLLKLFLKNALFLNRTLRYLSSFRPFVLSSFPTSRSTVRHRDKSI
jgi:lipopolysaccharide biosynthesis glycosyltransferase